MFVAGTGVSVIGDGIATALGQLSAGFGINSGQDSAGMVFALNYQNAARSLLTGVAAGIDACRKLGAKIQLCASNYSRAEAASKVGGGGHVLPSPGSPAKVAPPNAPDVMGAGVARPLLWGVVESLLDDVWPNGNAVGMHAAAGCWRGLGASLSGVQAALNGPKSVIAGQQIPEGELVQHNLALLAAIIGKLGPQCDKLADTLDDFADEVDDAQNKIRDLLNRLGSLTDLVHDAILIFEGDALDELEKIANDINGVLHNMKREAHAREQVLKTGMQIIDRLVVRGQHLVDGQLVEFFGEDVGSVAAGYFDAWTDFGEGVFKGAVGAVEFADQLDPSRFAFDPKGAAASWAALDKTAVQSIPAYALFDPAGAAKTDLGLVKGLTHWDDLTSDRPGVGLGEIGFDLGTMAGGGGAAKSGVKAAEAAGGAEATGDLAEGEGALQGVKGAAAEAEGAGGALPGIAKTGSDITKDLENLDGDLPKGDAPPSGSPVSLPPGKLPDAPVESVPRPADGAPGAPHAPDSAPGSMPAPDSTPPEAPRPGLSDGPHEPASVAATGSPAGAVPTVVGERLPSALSQPIDHSPPVSPNGFPGGAVPFEAHSPAPASPHFAPPNGHPAEVPPLSGGWHGPAEKGTPAGHQPGGAKSYGDGGDPPEDRPDGRSPDGDDPSRRRPDDTHLVHGDDGSADGLTADKRDEIIAMPKGTRPDPTEYLSSQYIEKQLRKFDDGATRFMPESNLEKYGIAQRDGTSFVMPKHEADTMTAATGGDFRAMETELGLPRGFLDSNKIVRIDIADPGNFNLRIPSGNEAGANEQWIPGGVLPNGSSEAVVDGGWIGPGDYTVTDVFE